MYARRMVRCIKGIKHVSTGGHKSDQATQSRRVGVGHPVVFVRAGITKLAGPAASGWAGRLAHWGYPPYARYVIGTFEILGGLGVLIPRCRRSAAVILAALMLGALATHAVYREYPRLLPPLVLGGLAFAVYASRLRPRGEQTPR